MKNERQIPKQKKMQLDTGAQQLSEKGGDS